MHTKGPAGARKYLCNCPYAPSKTLALDLSRSQGSDEAHVFISLPQSVIHDGWSVVVLLRVEKNPIPTILHGLAALGNSLPVTRYELSGSCICGVGWGLNGNKAPEEKMWEGQGLIAGHYTYGVKEIDAPIPYVKRGHMQIKHIKCCPMHPVWPSLTTRKKLNKKKLDVANIVRTYLHRHDNIPREMWFLYDVMEKLSNRRPLTKVQLLGFLRGG